MVTRIAAATLLVAVFSFVAIDAQAQKKTKEPAGSIELTKTDAGKWRYRIKDAEGKTIAMPLPQMHWDTKKDALKAIDELKSILETATPVEAHDDGDKAKKTEKKTDKS